MSSVIISIHGRKVYRHHGFPCICVDFDYWGKPATLQVPYGKYRPVESVNYFNQNVHTGMPRISTYRTCITGKPRLPDTQVEPVPDHELQKRLKAFKNDGTGRDNTDTLMRYNSPAAQLCRNMKTPWLHQGYFDLGNVYETAIIWLELDTMELLDPTAKDYIDKILRQISSEAELGIKHPNAYWSSSEYDSFSSWSVLYNGYVHTNLKTSVYGVIPSRVVLHDQ